MSVEVFLPVDKIKGGYWSFTIRIPIFFPFLSELSNGLSEIFPFSGENLMFRYSFEPTEDSVVKLKGD